MYKDYEDEEYSLDTAIMHYKIFGNAKQANMGEWVDGVIASKEKDEMKVDENEPNIKIIKPCHKTGFCPYGQMVEEFPLKSDRDDKSCEIFGHDCPAFRASEAISEGKQETDEKPRVLNIQVSFAETFDESKHKRAKDGKFTNGKQLPIKKKSEQENKTLNPHNPPKKNDESKTGSPAPQNSQNSQKDGWYRRLDIKANEKYDQLEAGVKDAIKNPKEAFKKFVGKAQGIVDKYKLAQPLKKAGYSENVANKIALTSAVLLVAPNFPGMSFALGGAAYGVPLVAAHAKKRINGFLDALTSDKGK